MDPLGLSGVTPDAGPARSIPWPRPVQTGFSVRHLAAVPAPRPLTLCLRSQSGLFSFIGGPEQQCLPAWAQMSPVPKSPAGLGLYLERWTDDLPATTLLLPSVGRVLSQVHPHVTLNDSAKTLPRLLRSTPSPPGAPPGPPPHHPHLAALPAGNTGALNSPSSETTVRQERATNGFFSFLLLVLAKHRDLRPAREGGRRSEALPGLCALSSGCLMISAM